MGAQRKVGYGLLQKPVDDGGLTFIRRLGCSKTRRKIGDLRAEFADFLLQAIRFELALLRGLMIEKHLLASFFLLGLQLTNCLVVLFCSCFGRLQFLCRLSQFRPYAVPLRFSLRPQSCRIRYSVFQCSQQLVSFFQMALEFPTFCRTLLQCPSHFIKPGIKLGCFFLSSV